MRDAFFAESGLTLDGIIHRVYREPMANRFLASLSPFIHSHIADAGVRGIVVDNFRCFLRNNVACYNRPDIPLGVVGSIGYVYKEELVEAAEAEAHDGRACGAQSAGGVAAFPYGSLLMAANFAGFATA